jgi:hypothetical protein
LQNIETAHDPVIQEIQDENTRPDLNIYPESEPIVEPIGQVQTTSLGEAIAEIDQRSQLDIIDELKTKEKETQELIDKLEPIIEDLNDKDLSKDE